MQAFALVASLGAVSSVSVPFLLTNKHPSIWVETHICVVSSFVVPFHHQMARALVARCLVITQYIIYNKYGNLYVGK